MSLDASLADRLDRWTAANPAAASAWRAVTTAGQPLTWEVATAVVAVVLWLRRNRRTAVFALLAVFGCVAWYDAVKAVVGRHRPVVPDPLQQAHGASFPSGHAMASAVAMALVVLAARQLLDGIKFALVCVAATLIAAAVAFSRLALAVHYPSDVLGGWLLATAWLFGLSAAMRVWPDRPLSRRAPRSTTSRAADPPRAG